MVAVADVFDALTTARPYKPALSLDVACDELLSEALRGWRNPSVVDTVVGLARSGRLTYEEAGFPTPLGQGDLSA